MKVAAVVVLYNPDGDIYNRISFIASQVDDVIVYDNSVDKCIIGNNKSLVSKIINAHFYSEEHNNGIGTALNYGVEYAKNNGYDYLLTFDQDTVIPLDYVSKIIGAYESEENIGVIGPIYNDVNANRECRFPVKRGPLVIRETLSSKKDVQDVMSIISSGSLYHVPIFEKVGSFKDEYFIDYIDNEFCLRLLKFGYRVCVDPKIVINHALGNRTKAKVIFKFSPTNYPYYRKYYITRNRLFVYKKYFLKYPSFVLYDLAAFMLDLFRVVFLEENKKIKLNAYWMGIKDFLKGNTGVLKS
ncbi:glycosyltransferase family 2 protein [Gibbsiella quercinecans]|uniref:glycosyltransferase family 2 protein n=1 Tax=Gibbsiella quercinecans TaxID=929813 RepID=UPI003A4D235D